MVMMRTVAVIVATLGLAVSAGIAQEQVPVSAFATQSHIHGLAVDPTDSEYLLIASHHGLFRAGVDGMAEQVSVVQDFMGFSTHPTDPSVLFASGHPATGGNLGFIVSTDGGESWFQRSPGLNGPVDFHQMAVSRANPDVIYGSYGSLQVSRDGGSSWAIAGGLPEQVVDLSGSAVDPDIVYAAAVGGLYVSRDGGESWQEMLPGAPVSLVEVAPDGSLYAFVLGSGLFRAEDEGGPLERIDSDWVEPFLFHLAVDPADPQRMFAVTATGLVVISADGGRTWSNLGEQ